VLTSRKLQLIPFGGPSSALNNESISVYGANQNIQLETPAHSVLNPCTHMHYMVA